MQTNGNDQQLIICAFYVIDSQVIKFNGARDKLYVFSIKAGGTMPHLQGLLINMLLTPAMYIYP